MRSLFSKWQSRRQQKKQLRELADLSKVFNTVSKMEQSGLMAWDARSRRLFIEQPLALLMMTDSRRWHNFIQNCYLYYYYKQSQEAWQKFMQEEELAAVRRYHATASRQLTRADIERIRRARRDEIMKDDMQPPAVEGFEFFIVTPPDLHTEPPLHQQGGVGGESSPAGRLVAVGHFDPETEQMEIAPWSEVQLLL